MRKRILIFCTALTTLGLMAFGIMDWSDPATYQLQTSVSGEVAINTQAIEKIEKRIFSDFIYDVGPRFGPIKKGDLDKARSIDGFFEAEQMQAIVSLKSVSVIIIKGDKQTDKRETGYSDELTIAQLKLLQSADYSTNFLIRAEYQQKNKETGVLEDSYSTPHLTIVPEKQAVYVIGKKALIAYLEEYIKENTVNIKEDELQPAKLYFTVTKKGTISNVRLDRTSGYPSIDKKMIELMTKAPGAWDPAETAEGIKVDQELVISFGLMGC